MNSLAHRTARSTIATTAASIFRGVPIALALFVALWLVFGLIDLRDHPDHLTSWVMSIAFQVMLCGVAWWAYRHVRSGQVGRIVTVGVVLSLAGSMAGYFAATGTSAEILAMVLIVLLVGLSLLIPLGTLYQSVVSAGIVGIYTATAFLIADPGLISAPVFVSLLAAGLVTVVGSYMTTSYRQATRLAREQQQEAAEIAGALVRVAETISRSLDPQQVSDAIVHLTCSLMRCEGGGLWARREGGWQLISASSSVFTPELMEQIRSVEFEPERFPIFRALQRDGVVEIGSIDGQDLLPPALLRRWRATSALTALLGTANQPTGMLVALHERRSGPFSVRDRKILAGIAQLGTLALENAYLAERLRTADRAKSELVATMSHELRTPLNAILGYTDLLLDGAMGEVQREQHEVLQRMRDRGLDLLNLIQATLDANRLETGRVMVHLTKLSLGEIVDRLREQIPERWLNPSVALRFSVQAPEAQLWTDEPKLLTILRNLVHNGLKFTQKGEVRVSVARDGEGVLFEVRDTGCGIERDQEARIFEIFGQADGRSSQEGVGLGLYICQRLAILLGGEIGVQSSPGLGSTFRVRLPQQPPQHLSSDV